MGQVGIRCIIDQAVRPGLKNALRSQLREYDMIEKEACSIAAARGWELSELDPAAKAMAKIMTRATLSFDRSDSKIAAMMIQGNTRGVIKGLKNRHQLDAQDSQVSLLSQKLLDCETDNIRQMQGFV